MLRKYYTQTGKVGVSVHSLRHTFGAHHAAKGTHNMTIQEVLGNRDVRNTEIYLSLTKELQRKDLQQHEPNSLERIK